MRIMAQKEENVDCFIFSVIQSDDMIRNFQILHCRDFIKPKFFPFEIPASSKKRNKRTPCGLNCLFCEMYKDESCSGCPSSQFWEKKYKDFLSEQV
jgi:hypothetical protein